MDRRRFLRSTSLAVRPMLPGGGIVGKLLSTASSGGNVTSILKEYGALALTGLRGSYPRTEGYGITAWSPDPVKLQAVIPFLRGIMQNVGSIIENSSSDELYNSLFLVDRHIGAQIFFRHFLSFNQEQRTKSIEHLFLVRQLDDDEMPIDENIGDHFGSLGSVDGITPQMTYLERYAAQQFHMLSGKDFQIFIDALPQFGEHFHRNSVFEFCSSLLEIDNYQNLEVGLDRLSRMFHLCQDKGWGESFLRCAIQEWSIDDLNGLPKNSRLLNSPLVRESHTIMRKLKDFVENGGGWKSFSGIETYGKYMEFQNTLIDESLQSIGIGASVAQQRIAAGRVVGTEEVGIGLEGSIVIGGLKHDAIVPNSDLAQPLQNNTTSEIRGGT